MASPLIPRPEDIKLIVGLGNPASEYEHTFHNLGRFFVSKFAAGAAFKTDRHFSYCQSKPILALSEVFMNTSGLAVKNALKFFKLKPKNLLLVHDDSDLPLGRAKLDFARGAAGHHGVESVIRELGANQFWRLRLGIRKETKIRQKAGVLVLKKAASDDFIKIYSVASKLLILKLKLKSTFSP